MVSSVGVACTRTLRPLMSSMFLISRFEYMLRRPSVESAITWAPCTVSAIMALTASENIADDAVARRLRLIVGEAIMFDFLRQRACRKHDRRCDDRRTNKGPQIF